MHNVYFDCRPDGTNIVYEPLAEVKIEPTEMDELNSATVKVEPEFVDVGASVSAMDVEYEPPVDIKIEPLENIDAGQSTNISSSTEPKNQDQMKSEPPHSSHTSEGPSKRFVSIDIIHLHFV